MSPERKESFGGKGMFMGGLDLFFKVKEFEEICLTTKMEMKMTCSLLPYYIIQNFSMCVCVCVHAEKHTYMCVCDKTAHTSWWPTPNFPT